MSKNDIGSVINIIRAEYSKLKIPQSHDKVFKDECVLSFDNPFVESGLYVNLKTLFGVGRDFLRADSNRTGSKLYLLQKWSQIPKTIVDKETVAPSKLAIGVDGGFITEESFIIAKSFYLVVILDVGEAEFQLPNESIPGFISSICDAIINNDGMRSKMQLDTWDASQEKFVSKYCKDLPHVKNGKIISNDPSTWKCEASGDSNNLWLNLSTGFIGGGRKNWDGTGGSGAALQHYIDSGKKYPLCVKLGTITPHGADVWSYADDEDTLVDDPYLAEHLKRWGIDIMTLEKTEKTLGEMEVDINQNYKWSRIIEEGKELTPISGPGYVGLENIGSSCYMNSILQALFSIPEIRHRYYNGSKSIYETIPEDPSTDFITQFCKLANALLSTRYIPKDPLSEGGLEKYKIAPRMFKHVVSKNHREFSSSRQQDASEYFQHLLTVVQIAERSGLGRTGAGPGASDTSKLFKFELEQKLQCSITGQVKYSSGSQYVHNILELLIPLEASEVGGGAGRQSEGKEQRDSSSNQYQYQDKDSDNEEKNERKRQRIDEDEKNGRSIVSDDYTRPTVPFSACLEKYFSPEVISFRNPSLSGIDDSLSLHGTAVKSDRFKSFPRYLVVKLARYYVDATWTQRKIDVNVTVPTRLDLRHLRSEGLQPGEEVMPDKPSSTNDDSTAAPSFGIVEAVDDSLVVELTAMGFSENGVRRAIRAIGNPSKEVAVDWIMEHIDDPDLNDPILPPPTEEGRGIGEVGRGDASGDRMAAETVDEEVVMMLADSLGFSKQQVTKALKATSGDVDRAADWLFSHAEDMDFGDLEEDTSVSLSTTASTTMTTSTATSTSTSTTTNYDEIGEGIYELHAVVSHIGRSADHGHYVCHVREGGERWILYNDSKVAISQCPPANLGFLYFFRRIDIPPII